MINGLEGIPGSGKSYEAVAYHVLPMLQAGRKVITNLPLVVDMFAAMDPSYRPLIELRRRPAKVLGTWDADRMDDDGNGQAFELFDDPALIRPVSQDVTVFGHVWDFYSDWKHPETGLGPVFIIDEAHVALPQLNTDKQVVEWFKLHRHFNVDVLLMTQSFRDINQPIARLIAMLVICRKADILGKKDRYIRKVKSGYRGAVISTEERPYKPEFFPLYKSHTNGNSVAESAAGDVSPFIVKFKRFSRVFWVFTLVACVYAFWPAGDKKTPQAKPAPFVSAAPVHTPPVAVKTSAAVAPAPSTADAPAPEAAAAPPEDEPTPEPYGGQQLHLTGRITMNGKVVYTFAISQSGQRIGALDSRDLLAAGYRWQPLTDCAGTLRWGTTAKAITCNAPILAAGTNEKPVVIAVPAGGGAPVASTQPGFNRGSGGSTATEDARTLPMPTPPAPDPSRITQADITGGLRARNPLYSGPAS